MGHRITALLGTREVLAAFGGRERVYSPAAVPGGSLVSGPASAEAGCISQVLASVGVRPLPPAADEFESVGLNTRRYTDDWLPEAQAD